MSTDWPYRSMGQDGSDPVGQGIVMEVRHAEDAFGHLECSSGEDSLLQAGSQAHTLRSARPPVPGVCRLPRT